MVACGFTMLFLIGLSFYHSARQSIEQQKWLLKVLIWAIPLPWIANEMGWFVAEYGRQPWSIGEVLPTHLSVSSRSVEDLWLSIGGFVVFYTGLLVVELFLMFRFARLGPSALHTGRYHFEQQAEQGSVGVAAAQPMQARNEQA